MEKSLPDNTGRAGEEPVDSSIRQTEGHTRVSMSRDQSPYASQPSRAVQYAADGGITLTGGRLVTPQAGIVGDPDGDSGSEVSTLPPPYSSEIDYN